MTQAFLLLDIRKLIRTSTDEELPDPYAPENDWAILRSALLPKQIETLCGHVSALSKRDRDAPPRL